MLATTALLCSTACSKPASSSEVQDVLFLAAIEGNLEVAEYSLKEGAKINHPDEFGATALLHAVVYDKLDMVKLLLSKGAKVSESDNWGNYPLLLSTIHNRSDISGVLLAAGASPNQKNIHDLTACVVAKKHRRAHLVEQFKENGTPCED